MTASTMPAVAVAALVVALLGAFALACFRMAERLTDRVAVGTLLAVIGAGAAFIGFLIVVIGVATGMRLRLGGPT